MLKSFFKIAIRCLWRKKTYSILNFVCLTFGLTCAIITALYIRNVLGYDKFQKNYSRLFEVEAYVTYFNGDRFPKEYLSASLVDVLKEQAPEIEEITRIAERKYSFMNGDKTFTENGYYTDDNFFNIFTFPLAATAGKNILSDQNSIVISERMADKFFESSDCVGKTLTLKDGPGNTVFKVAGVFKEIPSQSVMQFDFIIPFTKFLSDEHEAMGTGATACETWILLKDPAAGISVASRIKDLIKKQETTLNQELFLFPLKEKVLYSYAGGKRVWKEMQNLVIIGSIGLAILLIACFNFINLAIALNFRRYREAGIRKAAGSGKRAIILQFLGETFIITMLSFLIALLLVRGLLPLFNTMFHYNIRFGLFDFSMIVFFIGITLFTGLISGLLPALYLSSSDPVDALKGKVVNSNSYSIFRQGLIVFQFAIPCVLIICLMIIKVQDRYMRNYDAGIDKERVIIMDNTVSITSHVESFKRDLLAIPGIEAVSFTNCVPTRGASVSGDVTWEGKDVTEKLHFWCINSDFDYNKTVKIEIADGRFFNSSFPTDSEAYLINDVAAGVMKNKNPLGSVISVEGQKGPIIGVFKNFHSIDLAGPIVPTIIRFKPDELPIILVKISSGNFRTINGKLREVYQQYDKERPFNATLFRDLIPYTNLSLPSSLVGAAFIFSLLLACMGLFGLSSFTAENRTKEIGIRKSNGATTASVMFLLLKGYNKWLMISFVIAVPLAFMFAKSFLGRFYFHTHIPLWTFIAGPLIASMVALLTVSSLTWRLANQNPVKALRYE